MKKKTPYWPVLRKGRRVYVHESNLTQYDRRYLARRYKVMTLVSSNQEAIQ